MSDEWSEQDAAELVEEIEETIETIQNDYPDAYNKGESFFDDVLQRAKDVLKTIERTGRVSPKQAQALSHWRDSVQKWIHDDD